MIESHGWAIDSLSGRICFRGTLLAREWAALLVALNFSARIPYLFTEDDVVPSLVVRENSQDRIEELCAELNRALDQRKLINSDRIRRLLNGHIRDLKAELIVLGRL